MTFSSIRKLSNEPTIQELLPLMVVSMVKGFGELICWRRIGEQATEILAQILSAPIAASRPLRNFVQLVLLVAGNLLLSLAALPIPSSQMENHWTVLWNGFLGRTPSAVVCFKGWSVPWYWLQTTWDEPLENPFLDDISTLNWLLRTYFRSSIFTLARSSCVSGASSAKMPLINGCKYSW